MTYDYVNQPNHYTEGRKYEPDLVIEDWELNYRLGCVVKYLARNGRKPGEDPVEGLRKAKFYLEREIEALSGDLPYAVTYQDVLEDHAACALEEEQYDAEQALDSQYDLWMERLADVATAEGTDFWDPSLGPTEPPEEEEYVAIIERHHFPRMGVRRDGSTVVLPDDY